jgi:nicotinic acid phosphoribosyltransferase
MTAWDTEEEAILNEIEHFGAGVYACVMDSYDYDKALSDVLPKIAEAKEKRGGTIILRPDSGDPVEQVRVVALCMYVCEHVIKGHSVFCGLVYVCVCVCYYK